MEHRESKISYRTDNTIEREDEYYDNKIYRSSLYNYDSKLVEQIDYISGRIWTNTKYHNDDGSTVYCYDDIGHLIFVHITTKYKEIVDEHYNDGKRKIKTIYLSNPDINSDSYLMEEYMIIDGKIIVTRIERYSDVVEEYNEPIN
jgi:hypothetical protein